MNLNVNTAGCDRQQLELYLDGQLTDDENGAVESDLSDCADCRQTLETLVGGREDWQAAQSWLSADEFDRTWGKLPACQDDSACDSQVGRLRHEADILSREIDGWLDPTDDPKSMGRFAGYEIVGIVGHGGKPAILVKFQTETVKRLLDSPEPRWERIAVFIDGRLLSAEMMMSDGTLEFTGSFSGPEAERIVEALNAGKMAAKPDFDQARQTAERFLSALLSDKPEDVITLGKQAIEFREALSSKRLDVATVHVNDAVDKALVVTTEGKLKGSQPDGSQSGCLLLTLIKRNNDWVIDDIDFDSKASAEGEIQRFAGRAAARAEDTKAID